MAAYRGVTGLGALTLTTEVCDWRRFPVAGMFMAFTSLTPSEYSSGERTVRDHITHAGNGPSLRGKKTGGRKRHIIVDTMGLLLVVMVTSASVQDRDGAVGPLATLFARFGGVRHVFADGGYAGKLVEAARWFCGITVEIVKKKEGQRGFEVLPRRWVVERTFAWITKCRRLDHDYERLIATSEAMVKWAMVKWAMVGLMTRRLAPSGRRPWADASAR